HRRLARVLGAEFAENAIKIDASREALRMTGYAALPTYSRGAAVAQYLFVNGRPVRDKMLTGALRAAYHDLLSRDRHPAAVLFLTCDPTLVDVNVHPAKSEVRFRDPALARGLIVSGLRHALAEEGHRASSTVAGATLGAFRPEATAPGQAPRVYQMDRPGPASRAMAYQAQAPLTGAPLSQSPGFADLQAGYSARVEPDDLIAPMADHPGHEPQPDTPLSAPLGAAR
ncbi:MAG TPA: DNA mismatch repair protein MutL, partial [Roseovarius nubinhibens]|nr:DNA mismatch repair protein MutL [Roseovarius nubinhibens]